MRWINQRRPVIGFAIASALLLWCSIGVYRTTSRVEHTYRVSQEIDALSRYFSEMESSQRGFLLASEVEYLDRYQRLRPLIAPKIERIKKLTSDNSRQKEFIKTLTPLVNAKLTTMNDAIAAKQLAGTSFAVGIIKTNKGKEVMEQLQNTLQRMKDEESSLLLSRTQTASNLLALQGIGGFLCVFWSVLILNQTIDELLSVNSRYKGLNQNLEETIALRTKELVDASHAKDLFLSVLSHELRTPLTAIIGWTKLLKGGALPQERIVEAIDVIERSAHAQTLLVEDVLDISRIITGKFKLSVRPCDVNKVIEQALNTLRPAIDGKGVKVQLILDTNRSPISGDPEKLQQVIWNVLSNAVKFVTPRTGLIQVRSQRVNSYLEISISDNGIGIDPNFLPYIFDRFRQADSSFTRVHGGLGLGLAIALQIVQLHGGTIDVGSEGIGRGSTFIIKLPVAITHKPLTLPSQAAYSAAPATLDFQPSSALSGLLILVVDDHDDARQVLKLILEQSGATVVEANSARRAMSLLIQNLPEVIVSDVGMPIEDGYTFIGKVRELPLEQGGNIPAIAVTAYARDEDKIRSLEAGFQAHISKPLEPEYLIAVVASLAGRGRSL